MWYTRSEMMESIGQTLSNPERTIRLDGADLLTSKGYTQVPNAILRSGRITAGAKLVYAMLLSYAWHNSQVFPGQDTLAKDAGLTRQTVNKYIKELEEKKYISIQHRGQGKTSIYTLHLRVDRG